jgi:hypothetical protein
MPPLRGYGLSVGQGNVASAKLCGGQGWRLKGGREPGAPSLLCRLHTCATLAVGSTRFKFGGRELPLSLLLSSVSLVSSTFFSGVRDFYSLRRA